MLLAAENASFFDSGYRCVYVYVCVCVCHTVQLVLVLLQLNRGVVFGKHLHHHLHPIPVREESHHVLD